LTTSISLDVRETFNRRFFDWVGREWEDEIASAFSRVSRVESVEAQSCLTVLRSLSTEDLKAVSVALNKSRRLGPTTVAGDLVGGVSAAERTRVKSFRDATWALTSNRWLTGPGGAWTSARADRKLLRKLIRDALPGVAGEHEEFGGNEWRYCLRIGEWRVYTHLDLSDRQQQLIYHHAVQLDSAHSLLEFESLMSWLGLGGGSRWNTLPPGKEHEAAETLRTLCDHFLGSLPSLLEGL
jgi:hypothetical protein